MNEGVASHPSVKVMRAISMVMVTAATLGVEGIAAYTGDCGGLRFVLGI